MTTSMLFGYLGDGLTFTGSLILARNDYSTSCT